MQLLFYSLNLFALIFWGLLILAPRAQLTARLSSAAWPFFILTAYYLLNLGYVLLWTPVSTLEAFFALPNGLYAGWSHYLVVDLFVGQHIYRSSENYNVWYYINQILTLMAAPLGVVMFLYRQRN